ncbi:MAG: hypothetical protein Q8P91_03330, partial [bacterium]|nr:hypothetical protein [bacterium]
FSPFLKMNLRTVFLNTSYIVGIQNSVRKLPQFKSARGFEDTSIITKSQVLWDIVSDIYHGKRGLKHVILKYSTWKIFQK